MKKTYASLSALLLIALLASCGGGGTTADTTAAGGDTAAPETESLFEADNIPDELDFGGKKVNILYWLENADYSDEMNGDVVDDALFNRDLTVEQRLNVDINNIGESYTWNTRNEYLGKIRASVQSGDGTYDIVSGQYATMPTLIAEGMYTELSQFDVLDFDKPWWVGDLIEQTAVKGKLYMATGDITTKTIKSVCCYFANKRLWTDYKLENPIEVVNAGKWTLDYTASVIKDTYRDLNGNSEKDIADQFGFINYNANGATGYISALGCRVTTMNKDGYPELSFGDERVHKAVERMCSFIHDGNDAWTSSDHTANYQAFIEGRSLMINGFFQDAGGTYKEMADDFYVLPYPKLDEAQEDYQTRLGEANTLFAITASCKEPAMAAAVMEALASESYRQVSPAYFEVAMKVKYSRDDETAQMLDLIRESVVFDLGAVYGSALGIDVNAFRECIMNNTPDWASKYASKEASFTAGIEKYYAAVEALAD